MALLKVSEFADDYSIRRTDVYKYRDRQKLIIVDGYVDTDDPINKIFIESRKLSAKVKVKPGTKEHVTVIPEQPDVKDLESTKETTEKTKRITRAVSDPLYLEFQKTNKLRDQKLEEDIRLSRIKNDRIEGRLLPTDLVKQAISEIISRYKMNYLQQTEQLLRDALNELQATNEQITKTCGKLIDISNESSKHAVTEAKLAMQNIINENINT